MNTESRFRPGRSYIKTSIILALCVAAFGILFYKAELSDLFWIDVLARAQAEDREIAGKSIPDSLLVRTLGGEPFPLTSALKDGAVLMIARKGCRPCTDAIEYYELKFGQTGTRSSTRSFVVLGIGDDSSEIPKGLTKAQYVIPEKSLSGTVLDSWYTPTFWVMGPNGKIINRKAGFSMEEFSDLFAGGQESLAILKE